MPDRPVLLDLFCGAGGAAVGYARAGFTVIGVDRDPQPNYPFRFIQADAMEFLDKGHLWIGRPSAIHASPPCQKYSTQTRGRGDHPDLVGPVRDRLVDVGLPFVIENVVGAPLINPVRLCGSSFGLGVRRHRLFESSLPLTGSMCDHASQPPKYPIYDHGKWYLSRTAAVYGHGGGNAKEMWADAMGIDWMTRPEMAQAIPPAYTEHIGRQILTHLKTAQEAA